MTKNSQTPDLTITRRAVDPKNNKTLLLAQAVMGFRSAFAGGNLRHALGRLHLAVLMVRGEIGAAGDYGTYLANPEIEGGGWRPEIISIGQVLHPDPAEAAEQWLTRARKLLDKDLVGSTSIGTRLKNTANLGALLSTVQATDLPARSIHDVKGLEFPAVCVVLSPKTVGRIIDVLTGTNTGQNEIEEARKIYVAASRAERLLAIATPKSRVEELKAILDAGGQAVVVSHVATD